MLINFIQRVKSKRIFAIAILILVTTLAFFGCNNQETQDVESSDDKLKVAVSILPQKTFVEKVAGNKVDVVLLVPPGNSPANYEPSPGEMEKFSDSSIYFSIGVPTEEANILPGAKELESLDIVCLKDKVAKENSLVKRHDGEKDHHIWLSPRRVSTMVEVIAKELGELDPKNKEVYKENAKEYKNELKELDKDLEEKFASLDNRKFIVYHPAFSYLADDYDLEMYALEKGGKDATPSRLEEMIDLAKAEDIRVIFYQEEIDSQQSQAFAEEIDGKTKKLAPLAPDYIDNLRKMAETMTEVLKDES